MVHALLPQEAGRERQCEEEGGEEGQRGRGGERMYHMKLSLTLNPETPIVSAYLRHAWFPDLQKRPASLAACIAACLTTALQLVCATAAAAAGVTRVTAAAGRQHCLLLLLLRFATAAAGCAFRLGGKSSTCCSCSCSSNGAAAGNWHAWTKVRLWLMV